MLKHVFFMALSTAFRLLTGVVVFIVMARVWGPQEFGLFMYWFTVTSLAALLVDYGFSQQLMREIGHAKNQTASLVFGVMSAKVLLALTLILLATLFCAFGRVKEQELILLWILLVTGILSSFAETFNAVFRGLAQYHEETRIAAWVNIIHVTLVVVLLQYRADVNYVAAVFLLSRALYLILSWRIYIRLVPAHLGKETRFFAGFKYIKSGFLFATETAFTNIQSQADTLIVNYFLGTEAVGVYQAGLRLMQGANTFAQVLSNVYLPSMAEKVNDRPGLKKLANRLYLQMLLLGVVCLLIFTFGGELIVHLLYGVKYQSLTGLMPWFGILLLIRYIAASHGITLSAIGLQSSRVLAISVALTVLLIVAYFAIPKFGLLGMLYASISAVTCLYGVYAATLMIKKIPLGINKLNALLLIVVLSFTLFMFKEFIDGNYRLTLAFS